MRTYTGPELLETRIAPSGGLVNVTLTNGLLHLAGDAADHTVDISAVGFVGIHLAASGGTQFVYQNQTVTSLDLLQPTGLVIDGQGGNDLISLNGIGKLKSLTVNGGDGNDALTLTTIAVTGKTVVTDGSGASFITLNGDSVYKGAVTVTAGGTASKTITLGNNQVFNDQFAITSGDADDTISVLTNSFTASKNVTIDAGAGTNTIAVGNASILGLFQVNGALKLIQGAHATGTSKTTFVEGQATIRGAFTLQETSGANTASVGTTASLKVGSLLAMGGSGADEFDFGSIGLVGDFTATGAVTFHGTTGALTAALATPNFTAGSIAFNGGTGIGIFTAADNYLHVLKTLTVTEGNTDENFVSIATNNAVIGGAVTFTGGAGIDNFFTVDGSLQIGGNLTVHAGTGANTIHLQATTLSVNGAVSLTQLDHATGSSTNFLGASSLTFKKALSISQGAGDSSDTVSSLTSLTVGGNLDLVTGDGADTINFFGEGLVARGHVTVNAGNGTNTVIFGATASQLFGDVALLGGTGSDVFTLGVQGLAKKKFKIDTGAGDSQVTMTGLTYGIYLTQGLTIQNATVGTQTDLLTINNITSAGPVVLTTGAAASTVTIDNIFALGSFALTTGDAVDTVNIEQGATVGASLVNGTTMIKLGGGDDLLNIGQGTSDRTVLFGKQVRLDGGDGVDKLNEGLAPVSAANHFAPGALLVVLNLP